MARIVHPGLSALLQQHLPLAEAQCQPLPDEPGLLLYLLDPDFPQHTLTAEQMRAVLNYPAYWAFCWASGQVLARFLREQSDWVRGKRVLDFGSGSGVGGIAAARLGAREVVACDIDADALAATAANAELNGVNIELRQDFAACEGSFDLILMADVLYDRENLHWLDRLAARATRVLVADSRIRNFSHPRYSKLGEWDSNTLPDLDESQEFRRVSIYAAGASSPPAAGPGRAML